MLPVRVEEGRGLLHQVGCECQMWQARGGVGGGKDRGKVNQRLISDSGGGESCGTKSAELIAHFIVALDHQASSPALDGVLFGERGSTAIAGGGKARRLQSTAHAESIAELKSGQKRLSCNSG